MSIQSEKEWEAERDVRTLAEAERIKADPKRLARATSKIAAQVRKLEEEKQAFLKVAGKNNATTNPRAGLLSRPVK